MATLSSPLERLQIIFSYMLEGSETGNRWIDDNTDFDSNVQRHYVKTQPTLAFPIITPPSTVQTKNKASLKFIAELPLT